VAVWGWRAYDMDMPTIASSDLLIYRPQGGLLAAVEVRNLPELTPDEAEAIVASSLAQPAEEIDWRYLLLVSQEVGYLWCQSNGTGEARRPDYQFSMAEILNRYAARPAERLSRRELEYIVGWWLAEIADGRVPDTRQEPEATLAAAGLYQALAGTHARISHAPA
jgi:hypothetical protein